MTKTSWLAALALTLAASPALAKAKAPAESFVCTQIMGVSVTGDWFGAGFEKGVDDDHYQAMWRKHAFIDQWANPKDELWAVPVTSPCKERATNPDRVIFTGVNWVFTTTEQWTDAFTKVVKLLGEKYPGLKRIELLTMLRGPKNTTCGSPMTVVAPVVDEAIAKVVAANPKLVVAGPKVYAPSCEVFTKGGPHYTPEGMTTVAKTYATVFAAKP
jgi:hypothetical protein